MTDENNSHHDKTKDDLPTSQINKIVEEKDALNTKRSTKQAVRLFRRYLLEKEVDSDFEHFDKQTLDQTLCKFYAEARTEDGNLYKNIAITYDKKGLKSAFE